MEGGSQALIKLQTCNSIKKRPRHRYFPVNFATFFTSTFFTGHLQNLIVFFHLVQIGNKRSFLLHEVLLEKLQSSRSKIFFSIGALKNFAVVIGKHLSSNLFLIKLQAFRRSATVLERDSC